MVCSSAGASTAWFLLNLLPNNVGTDVSFKLGSGDPLSLGSFLAENFDLSVSLLIKVNH